jgi:hypothetical protein
MSKSTFVIVGASLAGAKAARGACAVWALKGVSCCSARRDVTVVDPLMLPRRPRSRKGRVGRTHCYVRPPQNGTCQAGQSGDTDVMLARWKRRMSSCQASAC